MTQKFTKILLVIMGIISFSLFGFAQGKTYNTTFSDNGGSWYRTIAVTYADSDATTLQNKVFTITLPTGAKFTDVGSIGNITPWVDTSLYTVKVVDNVMTITFSDSSQLSTQKLSKDSQISFGVDVNGVSSKAESVTLTDGGVVPPVPTKPVVTIGTVGTDTADFTWTSVDTAKSYTIYENDKKIDTVDASKPLTEALAGLTPATAYTVSVEADDASGAVISTSDVATFTTQSATSDLKITLGTIGMTSVDFSWNSVKNASKYLVFLGNTQVDTLSTTSDSLDKLTPNTAYTLKVQAVDTNGTVLATSDDVVVTTKAEQTLTVSSKSVTDSSIDVAWTAPNGTYTYTITQNGSVLKSKLSATDYNSTGLSADTSYDYTVTAYNEAGTEIATGSATLKTNGSGPTPPPTGAKFEAYYATWDSAQVLSNVLPSGVNVVNLSFFNISGNTIIDTDKSIDVPDEGGQSVMLQYWNWTQFKYANTNAQVMLTIGGATYAGVWTGFFTTATDSEINTLVDNISKILTENYPVYKDYGWYCTDNTKLGNVQLDGIDLDLEAEGTFPQAALPNIAKFITAFKAKMPNKALSLTGVSTAADTTDTDTFVPLYPSAGTSAHTGELIPLLQNKEAMAKVDWVNAMDYDAGSKYVDPQVDSKLGFKGSMTNFAKFIDNSKIVLGLDGAKQWDPDQTNYVEPSDQLGEQAKWASSNGNGVMYWAVGPANANIKSDLAAIQNNITPGPGPTPTPSKIDVTAGTITTTTIPLSWKAVEGAKNYVVVQDGTESARLTTTSDTAKDLTADTSYTFQVKALDSEGSVVAISDTLTLTTDKEANLNLTLTGVTKDSISVKWDTVKNAVSYKTSSSVIPGNKLVGLGAEKTKTLTGLKANTNYSVTVEAKSILGKVLATSTITAKTSGDVPPAPTGKANASYWCLWGGNDSYATAGKIIKSKAIDMDKLDSSYNTVITAFIITGNDGNFELAFKNPDSKGDSTYTPEQLKDMIVKTKAEGKKVIVSVGGEYFKTTLTSTADETKFVTQVEKIIDDYGFEGLDLDLEKGATDGAQYLGGAVKTIADHYRAAGEDFWVTMAPEWCYIIPYTYGTGQWASHELESTFYIDLINTIGMDNITYIWPQSYNQGSANGVTGPEKDATGFYSRVLPGDGMDKFLSSLVWAATTDEGFAANGSIGVKIPASKFALGVPATEGAAGLELLYTATPELIKKASDEIVANNTTVSGFMNWSVDWDAIQINDGDLTPGYSHTPWSTGIATAAALGLNK